MEESEQEDLGCSQSYPGPMSSPAETGVEEGAESSWTAGDLRLTSLGPHPGMA